MGLKSLLLETFTWWNNQTLGTRIYTSFKGKKVGIDEKGNKFYVHRKNNKKRWIIYNGLMDASKVPALWHDWLHYRTDEIPNESDKNPNWYKIHEENTTGTNEAYSPELSKNKEPEILKKNYEPWNPE
ncbi:MAG: NADH:ubiquinone oxidoreductase subunit NDUFA12 [Pseudomonadota bacterium]|nr:NADH:ubiquinone oxidoreductase subunit NDUFA12 [Pseudomonadota bacterium]MEC7830629.1 NADH:ubiquinone oxidoreductase subunit NDUFA12 [Pseudomonadota bacterium]MEC9382597.1 NADH:ubiquinone oxidoreductase subunit NDUFA12 [Pseudomonadota bacterium]MEC9414329.1 NADH:ubiquinone oxidoreductase subunit NDUFA12 [Pseudomonadota bacterium]MEC9481353.1 NADH:ubiquinone oxidoreductase subunit NDUFA12 [Pseudomonadota bacterium]|tara:strand:+ start:67 stop:450 length:384 start_codon:yes stop_codon:yes gene_type:complete